MQDTLSFYGFFKQDEPHGRGAGLGLPVDQLCPAGGEQVLEHLCQKLGIEPGRDDRRRQADAGVCRMPGGLRARALHAGGRSTCTRIWMSRRRTEFIEAVAARFGIRESEVSEFQPVLLANIAIRKTATHCRSTSQRGATRPLRKALAKCRPTEVVDLVKASGLARPRRGRVPDRA